MKPIQLIPQQAVDRLLLGEAEILFSAFNHGLTVDVRWPHWHYPLLHGLAYLCPKRVDEMVDACLAQGASATEDYEGLTPLLLAISGWHPEHDEDAKQRRTECVTRLVEQSLVVDESMMIAAATVGYMEAIDVLVSNSVSIDGVDENGQTALHHAYLKEASNTARHLIESGADINAQDHLGQTPLEALRNKNGKSSEWIAFAENFHLEANVAQANSTRRLDPRL